MNIRSHSQPPASLSNDASSSPMGCGLRRSFCAALFTLGLCFALECAGSAGPGPSLEFAEPVADSVYSNTDEIPVLIHASATEDAILAAELFVDGDSVGDATFCCPFCPCAYPTDGIDTWLQRFAPWVDGKPPVKMVEGLPPLRAGMHRLVARAVSRNGALIESLPVTVLVVDRSLAIHRQTDGTVGLVIPEGSMTPGHFDLEVSPDLNTWTRIGEFLPGNVAAFFTDPPLIPPWPRRYYRSVFVPPGPPR